MDIFTAIKGRRSCRRFSDEPVDEKTIEKIVDAATWAPSPMNAQPWKFYVITDDAVKAKINAEGEKCRAWAIEQSGWKWLEKYRLDFLQAAPVLIVVVGDPKKTGMDMYMEDGGVAYQHACAAAIQNLQLAAHALGLGTLWFTMFDRNRLREILDVDPGKVPLALICLGKADDEAPAPPRKDIRKKLVYIR